MPFFKHKNLILSGFLFILVCASTFCHAQPFKPGYIVSENGDSLKGYILFKDHVFNRQNCQFKRTQDAAEQSFSPGEIEAYGIYGQGAFRSVQGILKSDEWVFVEYILDGGPDLFYYGSRFFAGGEGGLEELILETDTIERGGKIYIKDVEIYKQQLLDLFTDCPDISAKILQSRFDRKNVEKLFIAYYECKGESYKVVLPKDKWLKVRFGGGITANRLTINPKRVAGSAYYFAQTKNEWSNFLSPRVFLTFSYPRLNSRMELRVGAQYSSYTYSIADVNDQSGVDLQYEMDIASSFIQIPFTLIYNLSRKRDNRPVPYLLGGGSLAYTLSYTGDRLATLPTGTLLTRTRLDGRSAFYSYRVGIGGKMDVGNSMTVFGELYGENSGDTTAPSSSQDAHMYLRTIAFSLGVLF